MSIINLSIHNDGVLKKKCYATHINPYYVRRSILGKIFSSSIDKYLHYEDELTLARCHGRWYVGQYPTIMYTFNEYVKEAWWKM